MKKQRLTSSHVSLTQLRTEFFRPDEQTFAGYVVDENEPQRRFIVELVLDGYPYKIVRADVFANELAIESIGDGCYGFAFKLHRQAVEQTSIVEARIANADVPVGLPIVLDQSSAKPSHFQQENELRWLSGLHFDGWCSAEPDDVPSIVALIDGQRVAEAKAVRWANI